MPLAGRSHRQRGRASPPRRRSGAACRATRARAPRPRRPGDRERSRKPTPPYHQRSARVRPYQPGGHTRRPSTPLALDAVTSEDDVARDECAVVAKAVRGLADRIAERDGSRAIGDDSVERRVARDHLVRAAPVPVHGDDHADGAAKALDIAVERAPEARSVPGVLGHDRVDDQDRAGKLAVHAADLLDPSARAPGIGKPLGMRRRPAPQTAARSPALPGATRSAANRPRHPPVKRVPTSGSGTQVHRRGSGMCGSDPERYTDGTIGCHANRAAGREERDLRRAVHGARGAGDAAAGRGRRPSRCGARALLREGAVSNWHSHPGGQHLYLAARAAGGSGCPTASTRSRRASTSWRPRTSATTTARHAAPTAVWLAITWGVTDWEDAPGARVTGEPDAVVAGAGFAGPARRARPRRRRALGAACSRPGTVRAGAPGRVRSRARARRSRSAARGSRPEHAEVPSRARALRARHAHLRGARRPCAGAPAASCATACPCRSASSAALDAALVAIAVDAAALRGRDVRRPGVAVMRGLSPRARRTDRDARVPRGLVGHDRRHRSRARRRSSTRSAAIAAHGGPTGCSRVALRAGRGLERPRRAHGRQRAPAGALRRGGALGPRRTTEAWSSAWPTARVPGGARRAGAAGQHAAGASPSSPPCPARPPRRSARTPVARTRSGCAPAACRPACSPPARARVCTGSTPIACSTTATCC